jgi:glycosyltransferase involved in cell wall biosynthesis
MKESLAIIIPAYKRSFFEKTLQSIANQTSKQFTLYIGDDASPDHLYDLVEKYENDIKIIYKKFEKNLGAIDLVAHWERCIDLSEGEEWIWLFSDDDWMAEDCVELFQKFVANNPQAELLHFNTTTIDKKGDLLLDAIPFPAKLLSVEFFERKIRGELRSFAVEYIFKRELYQKKEKFQRFDLAWCTDDATWMKFAFDNGINTVIDTPKIKWRFSGENISSINTNGAILKRKIRAKSQFLKWTKNFFAENNTKPKATYITQLKWMLLDVKDGRNVSLLEKFTITLPASIEATTIFHTPLCIVYLMYYHLRSHFNKPVKKIASR